MKSTFSTKNPEETIKIGARIADDLQSGDIVALYGELGSGKTTFIKGICQAFDVSDWVKSPSFVIAREYPGRIPIYHLDLYRIDVKDPFPILEDYLDSEGILVIEWAEKVDRFLPPTAIRVRIAITEANKRRIEIDDPRD